MNGEKTVSFYNFIFSGANSTDQKSSSAVLMYWVPRVKCCTHFSAFCPIEVMENFYLHFLIPVCHGQLCVPGHLFLPLLPCCFQVLCLEIQIYKESKSLPSAWSFCCIDDILNYTPFCSGFQPLPPCFLHSDLCNNKETPFGLQQVRSLFKVCWYCNHEVHCVLFRGTAKSSKYIELLGITL